MFDFSIVIMQKRFNWTMFGIEPLSSWERMGRAYVGIPFQSCFWDVILFGILLEIFDELMEDAFEFFDLVGRRHWSDL